MKNWLRVLTTLSPCARRARGAERIVRRGLKRSARDRDEGSEANDRNDVRVSAVDSNATNVRRIPRNLVAVDKSKFKVTSIFAFGKMWKFLLL